MFGVVLVGTYTSVFIASPILIYLGVGNARRGEAGEPPAPEPTLAPKLEAPKPGEPKPEGPKPGAKSRPKSKAR
jgi:hypothetical protein